MIDVVFPINLVVKHNPKEINFPHFTDHLLINS